MNELSPYRSRVKAKNASENESNNISRYHQPQLLQQPTLRENAVFPSSSLLEQSKSGFLPSSPYNSKHAPDLYANLGDANAQRNLPFVQQQQQCSFPYGQRYCTSATTGRFSDQLRRNMTSSSNIITYSPPVTRRPPMAPRGIGGGGGRLLSQQEHKYSASLPSTSQDLIFSTKYAGAAVPAEMNGTNFYRGGYDDISLPSQAAANRRHMLNKMRQHRSLEGDALSSSHLEFSLPNFNQSLVGAGAYINDCNSSGSVPPADPHIRPSSAIYGQASPRFAQNYPSSASASYRNVIDRDFGFNAPLANRNPEIPMYDNYTSALQSMPGNITGQYGLMRDRNLLSSSTAGPSQNLSINPFAHEGPSSYPISQPLSISTNVAMAPSMSSNPQLLQPLEQSSNPGFGYCNYFANRDPYNMSLPVLQREFESLKREYESSLQKLGSCMNSIKTFWSPELKKERALRKEETSKLALMQEQLKMTSQEGQKQSSHIRQLQDELQCQYELSRTIRDAEIQSVPREEYDALRLERDRLHRELVLSKDTIREFEVQIETQRQTLASRDDSVKKLLDMLQNKGMITYSSAQDRLEVEQSRSRIIELENRCRSMDGLILQKDHDVMALREECMAASQKIRQSQLQYDRYQRISIDEREVGALQALLDTKTMRIEQLEQRMGLYEDEITKLRDQRLSMPRNFTDKSVTDAEYQEMKLKMEKLQLELSQKQSESFGMQSKLSTYEEQTVDAKKQLELCKESLFSKDREIAQLQSDIEALRAKLETRTETIEQKTQQLQNLQLEKNRLQSDIFDLNEQIKIRDSKVASLQRKMENNEELLKDKDHQIEIVKKRLASSPAMVQQKQFQEQLEEVIRERDRLLQQLREQRDRVEAERFEELDLHRTEVRNLRTCIESLQKEMSDREVLIESQNEKISDLNRDLITVRAECKRLTERGAGGENFYVKETNRLTKELHEARSEVDRLLKIVQVAEKEKERLQSELKDLEKRSDITKSQSVLTLTYPSGSLDRRKGDIIEDYNKLGSCMDLQNVLYQREQRVEELEEALKESVSITAERELAIAQQKQMTQQLELRLNQYKDQLNRVQHQYDDMNNKLIMFSRDKQDKDALVNTMKRERKKHIEEVLQLKEEALLAAISEKDAHIALLENSAPGNKTADEITTLRKHKDKLIKKLKEENNKRMKLVNEQQQPESLGEYSYAAESKVMKSSPNEQEDDAEGIWA